MKEFITKIQYAVLFALIVVAVPSCSDALDIDPEDSLTQSEIYNDYKDMYTIKLGLYDILQGLVEQSFVLGECRGDLVVAGPGAKGTYADVAEFLDNNISADNKYLDWSGYYSLINQCNDALVKYPILKLKQPKLETDEELDYIYKHIVGETLWLRAWAYFQLIQNWGDVPFYMDPVYTVEQSSEEKYNRIVDQDSILNQLERDLSFAFKHCEYNWGWSNLPGAWNHETVNMCAVVSLYTDVLMYREKYQQAWDVASKIVEGGYISSLGETFSESFDITQSKFTWAKAEENQWFKCNFRYANQDYFSGAYREEGLVLAFSIEGASHKPEKHPLTEWTNNRYADNGLYVIKPSYTSLQYFNGDGDGGTGYADEMRGAYSSYLIDDAYVPGEKDTIIWKYVGVACYKSNLDSSAIAQIERRGLNRSLGYGNINVCRTAGLWLRAAEAANRIGLGTKAVELLNEVRVRVEMGQSSVKNDGSVEEIENAIIHERTLELAYEGTRWYDLVSIAKRRNDPNYLIDKVVEKERYRTGEAGMAAMRARLQYQKSAIEGEGNENWWKLERPAVYRDQK